VTDEPRPHVAGRTSWLRFAVLTVPAAVIIAGMIALMGEGALAASFTISGQQAKVSADSLDGKGFAQYGWIDQTARGKAVPVAVSAIRHAELRNLCQSVVISLPAPIGDLTLKIKAGAGKDPVTADNMFIDMDHLSGDATFGGIEIGRDASTLNKGPAGAQGFQDMFAQQADTIHIDHLQQTSYATTAGTFSLVGLNLSLASGKDECF
jgi:hypothetical protein